MSDGDRSFAATPGHEREEAKRGPKPQSLVASTPQTQFTSTPAAREYQLRAFEEFMAGRAMSSTPQNPSDEDDLVLPPTPRPSFATLSPIHEEEHPLAEYWRNTKTPEAQMGDEHLQLTQSLTVPKPRHLAPLLNASEGDSDATAYPRSRTDPEDAKKKRALQDLKTGLTKVAVDKKAECSKQLAKEGAEWLGYIEEQKAQSKHSYQLSHSKSPSLTAGKISSMASSLKRAEMTTLKSPKPQRYLYGKGTVNDSPWATAAGMHQTNGEVNPVPDVETYDDDHRQSAKKAFDSMPNEVTSGPHYRGSPSESMTTSNRPYGGVRLPAVNPPTFSIRTNPKLSFHERAAFMRGESEPLMEVPVSVESLKRLPNAMDHRSIKEMAKNARSAGLSLSDHPSLRGLDSDVTNSHSHKRKSIEFSASRFQSQLQYYNQSAMSDEGSKNVPHTHLSAPALVTRPLASPFDSTPYDNFKRGPATSGWGSRSNMQGLQDAAIMSQKGISQSSSVSREVLALSEQLLEATQPHVDKRRKQAKLLAEFICSGALNDIGDSPTSLAGPSSGPAQLVGTNDGSYATATQNSPTPMFLSIINKPPTKDKMTPYLQASMPPSYPMLMEHIPFCNLAEQARPAPWGVIKICDIPYNTKRQEIVALFGRSAKIVNQPSGSPYYAIHIMIDRGTAKSMDCYVEMESPLDATTQVRRINTNEGRPNKKVRIQDRQVEVRISNMEELMSDLFPRAKKAIFWQGQVPRPVSSDTPGAKKFSFLHTEELFLIKQWAVNPQRSRFARNHLQRTYEAMMSILHKYPWYAHHLYTMGERNAIFRALYEMVHHLAEHLSRHRGAPVPQEYHVLTIQLLEEMLLAGCAVPAFSEVQRQQLCELAARMSLPAPAYVHQFAVFWPFQVLRMRLDVGEDRVHHYAMLLNRSSYHNTNLPTLAPSVNPFGDFRVAYPDEAAFNNQTLAEVAEYEMAALENTLKSQARIGTVPVPF